MCNETLAMISLVILLWYGPQNTSVCFFLVTTTPTKPFHWLEREQKKCICIGFIPVNLHEAKMVASRLF